MMHPEKFKAPMLVGKGVAAREEVIDFGDLRPHHVMHFLFTFFRHLFIKRLGAQEDKITAFWDNVHPQEPRKKNSSKVQQASVENKRRPYQNWWRWSAC